MLLKHRHTCATLLGSMRYLQLKTASSANRKIPRKKFSGGLVYSKLAGIKCIPFFFNFFSDLQQVAEKSEKIWVYRQGYSNLMRAKTAT